jgi:D-hydroxyproline dehydrogenase subunit gamma
MRADKNREKSLQHEAVSITINGKLVSVAAGTSVAAAILMAGEPCRISVTSEPRAPLCGMGICMECRVMVNGLPHQRSCQLLCTSGMEVVTE